MHHRISVSATLLASSSRSVASADGALPFADGAQQFSDLALFAEGHNHFQIRGSTRFMPGRAVSSFSSSVRIQSKLTAEGPAAERES